MEIRDGGAWANGINRSISTTSIAINQLAFIHGSGSNGGGLMADGNIDLYISDSEILWCVAAGTGGGIFTTHGVSLIMERTKILHNVAKGQGAGGYVNRGFLILNRQIYLRLI